MTSVDESFTLDGKVALITGGSGTIGLAIAQALRKKGMNVVLVGRTMETLQKAKSLLLRKKVEEENPAENNINPPLSSSSSSSNNVDVYSVDISKEESVIQLFEWIDQAYGRIDLLINNAGEYESISLKNRGARNIAWKNKNGSL